MFFRFVAALICLPPFAFWLVSVAAQDGENSEKPIRALLVTGGCCHNYDKQKIIIESGIAERCVIPIEWTVVHQGGDKADAKIPLFEDETWAEGFDVVVHNVCFPDLKDKEWVERILKPHRDGIPAVLIHCANQSYQVDDNQWLDFCGVSTKRSGPRHSFDVRFMVPDHPILKPLTPWTTPKGKLCITEGNAPGVTILAHSKSEQDGKDHPTIWVNHYGEKKTRVFATSIGNDEETMYQNEYLTMLTRGFLWSLDRLDETNLVPFESIPSDKPKPLNLGRNSLLSATSRASSEDSDLGHDGNSQTIWRPAKGGVINWWEGTLEKPEKLIGIAILWESDHRLPYIIDASEDGKTWTPLIRRSPPRLRSDISYHEVASTMKSFRISNPDTGWLNGIREVAVYSSIRQIPGHLRSARQANESDDLVVTSQPKKKRISWKKTLSSRAAFTILAKPDETAWPAAFDALSKKYYYTTVDGLLKNARSTKSGKFRHLAISALGRLYRDSRGNTWSESPKIAAWFGELLGNERIDQRKLFAEVTRNRIPLYDIGKIVKTVEKDPALKEVSLDLFEQTTVPYLALEWLGETVSNRSEDWGIRLRPPKCWRVLLR